MTISHAHRGHAPGYDAALTGGSAISRSTHSRASAGAEGVLHLGGVSSLNSGPVVRGGAGSFGAEEPIVSRPLLRWHGGKWRLAPWIIRYFPKHRHYVEPFGGGGSVLLRKHRSYAEVYNDLDSAVVTLFRVLRDPVQAARLVSSIELTPFAREEFDGTATPCDDPVEASRRMVARSFMGFGSDAWRVDLSTGFRGNVTRTGTTPAHDWAGYPVALRQVIARLAGVVIEHRDAVEVMERYDGAATLHYVDPPYLPETRSIDHRNHGYRHEMDVADHERLLDRLCLLKGMVVLSGYASALYDERLAGWRRIERETFADGARPRTEVLWINPSCIARLGHGPLFGEAAE